MDTVDPVDIYFADHAADHTCRYRPKHQHITALIVSFYNIFCKSAHGSPSSEQQKRNGTVVINTNRSRIMRHIIFLKNQDMQQIFQVFFHMRQGNLALPDGIHLRD